MSPGFPYGGPDTVARTTTLLAGIRLRSIIGSWLLRRVPRNGSRPVTRVLPAVSERAGVPS